MFKTIPSLCLLIVLASVACGKDQPLVIDKLAETHENTSADAILTVEKHQTDDGLVLHFNLHLFTEYVSRKGTGRAYAALVIFDRHGQQLDTIEAGNTDWGSLEPKAEFKINKLLHHRSCRSGRRMDIRD